MTTDQTRILKTRVGNLLDSKCRNYTGAAAAEEIFKLIEQNGYEVVPIAETKLRAYYDADAAAVALGRALMDYVNTFSADDYQSCDCCGVAVGIYDNPLEGDRLCYPCLEKVKKDITEQMDACATCGCLPGDGITETCDDEDGCGFAKEERDDLRNETKAARHAVPSPDRDAKKMIYDATCNLAEPDGDRLYGELVEAVFQALAADTDDDAELDIAAEQADNSAADIVIKVQTAAREALRNAINELNL